MPGDEELMSQTGRGNLEAFEQLVLRHQARVWRTAFRFLGDPVEAEDAAQDTFLRILEAAPRYRPAACFVTYLTRVVTRLCLDRVRKKQPAYTDELPELQDSSVSPMDALAGCERSLAIQNALDRLPPRQRAATVLRHYEGCSYRDIASAMGVSRKAVERLLARAREALQRLLGKIAGQL